MTPLVSIVIPVFNDADVIANALDSCLRQTLAAIEVIVVDDASTDQTAEVVERYVSRDSRVRLIRQQCNASAYQARLVGVSAANAKHLLFLDGDDELNEDAARAALAKATDTNADLVQFGVEVIHLDGRTGGPFEARLQPKYSVLSGINILRELFPIDRPAQGQLWRYLFRRQLLVEAYSLMPADLVLPRVNDLPITFLVIALAQTFVSIPDRLYRYHFGRGGSGQRVRDIETAVFYSGAIRSVDSIEPAVRKIADDRDQWDLMLGVYASVRRAIIGYTTHYLLERTRSDLIDAMLKELLARASASDIVQSTALHWPQSIDAIAANAAAISPPKRPVRSVLIATNSIRTGGISNVVVSQARLLQEMGLRVLIAATDSGSESSALPSDIELVEVSGDSVASMMANWAELCLRRQIDLVIDHQWQYSTTWHTLALAARAEGVATIGWSHNFAGRSLLFGSNGLESAPRYFPLLTHLVVLSPLDAAFWKLRGMPRVSYLPNPPSQFLRSSGVVPEPRAMPSGRRLEIVWWGRLQQRTKRVTELVDVAHHLYRMGIDFRIRIIGPDWRDLKAATLNTLALNRGLGERIQAIGPLKDADLLSAIDESDLFVNTSLIEGYPLVIPEAQARGLPIAMYDLPWLAILKDNAGIEVVKWGDSVALAHLIAAITQDAVTYTRMSEGSRQAATRELSRDFSILYDELISGKEPLSQFPPSLTEVSELLDILIRLTEERSSKNYVSTSKQRTSKTDSKKKKSAAAMEHNSPRSRRRSAIQVVSLITSRFRSALRGRKE